MPFALIIPADYHDAPYIQNLDGLDEYQQTVGGNIETIPYRENVVPYFNEEGKILDLPVNPLATAILKDSLAPGDYIAGTCIFLGFDPETGEERDFDAIEA